MNRDSKIYVAGHRGLVGSALVRRLEENGYKNIITRTHEELDLINQLAVRDFFEDEKPEYVFLAAAKVGGILANNTYPAEFIYQNIAIQANVIHESWRTNVKRLLFLGSSCIYPRDCPQPIKEEYLLTGSLEPTNRPYAIAKISGIEMCWSYNRQYDTNFLAVMPTNLYGPNDNFNLETSHVIPALIRKMHEAKSRGEKTVSVWGTGKPLREFLHSRDLAQACLHIMCLPEKKFDKNLNEDVPPLINIGYGKDFTIKELVVLIKDIVGFEGEIVFDLTMPDGTMKKLLDIEKVRALGWSPQIGLKDGLAETYTTFMEKL
ncbi:MAG: GDP-L-fucose synthase family protein [Gammaproteobacteria bacterium]